MLLEISLLSLAFAISLFAFVLWKRPFKKHKKTDRKENKRKQKELPKKKRVLTIQPEDVSQKLIVDFAIEQGGNNIYTRHQQKTAAELDKFDRSTPLTKKIFEFKGNYGRHCYGCGQPTKYLHPVYIFSCRKCGTIFQQKRYLSRDLKGHVSLVIGCRTKLGHQVSLKLLRAGSIVIGTTRYPERATNLFSEYEDFEKWNNNFDVYSNGLDLDTTDLESKCKALSEYILNKYKKLDNLIICAAQTIRVREKDKEAVLAQTNEFNRYGDAKFVEEKYVNSWQMNVSDITQQETEECMRINAIGPVFLVKNLIEVMKNSDHTPYIISVHAREGLFEPEKGPKHIHTNMAKAALHMMTRTLIEDKTLATHAGKRFSIHGCDPGWISVDEYYEKDRPFNIPPLDEIDGAARILYPLFKNLPSSRQTRRQFNEFVY
ncbi:hypothetical protein M9Y10_025819 [Tritrichomonas musculus]|uniref:Oxidoreductase n=1 Tax=Tritrichomonas musculus TaxID=1915356 RepID=A0ABR2H9R6_9EUKA